MLSLPLGLVVSGCFPHLLFDLLVLLQLDALHVFSIGPPIVKDHLLAFVLPPESVRTLLLCGLFLEKSLDEIFFVFGGIEALLDLPLIDHLLPIPPFSLFRCKLVVVLGLFDLVHCSGVGKVLDLARWYSLLLLLALDCFFDWYLLFYALSRHIFIELVDTSVHICRMVFHLFHQFVLIQLYLTVLKIELSINLLSSNFTILLPILAALCFPVLHELFVFL